MGGSRKGRVEDKGVNAWLRKWRHMVVLEEDHGGGERQAAPRSSIAVPDTG